MEFGGGFRARKIEANGIQHRLVTSTDEQKPPLLMIHGIYDRAEGWAPVADQLARDYWLIMPDLRGHHQTDWPDEGYRLSDYAADAVGILDALDVERPAVLGHSLGALITMALAGEYGDRVRVVVLEDPPSERSEDTRTWVRAHLSAKRGTPKQTFIAMAGINPDHTEEDWRREAEWLRETADGPFLALADAPEGEYPRFETAIDRISCPILLMQADPRRDAALSTTAARQAVTTHEDLRLVNFPGSGHMIHHDSPEKFVEAVRAFLGER